MSFFRSYDGLFASIDRLQGQQSSQQSLTWQDLVALARERLFSPVRIIYASL
jgi:hypothetical protein